MFRWVALLLLLGSSSGCVMIEDMVLGPPPPHWENSMPNKCGTPQVNVNAGQTAEPEMLRR